MKNLVPGTFSSQELLHALDELEEKLNNLDTKYPDPIHFKSPFHEEEDDHH